MISTHRFHLPTFDPCLAWQRLCPDGPGFLESAQPHTKIGRHSLLPLHWRESYSLRDDRLWRHDDNGTTPLAGQPWDRLQAIWQERNTSCSTESPLFPGGFFGYLGYDLAWQFESLPRRARRDLPFPDLWLCWVDLAATYDHGSSMLTLASLDPGHDLRAWENRLRNLTAELDPKTSEDRGQVAPILAAEEFCAMVRTAKDYIAAGDIYQANLSCRFDGTFSGSSSALYRRLRSVNPSPFATLIHTPEGDIISSSPERLVSLRNGIAETRPIAGTRRRGRETERSDQDIDAELLANAKERAEHIMLLDLERNDLGRVCRTGSVQVNELMVLERYSHVTHIVSNVCGELAEGTDPFDLLRATFPGGTITGVPKKRCMEIIEELEPVGRYSYTGSAGYLSVCGDMDFNILIRTFQKFEDRITYQVGAGIVADSDPLREWHECLAKGAALQAALEGP